MRIVTIVLLALCAGTTWAQEATPYPGVTLVDARPPAQRKTKFESLTLFRCMYGSRRVGDADEGVQRIASLEELLDGMPALSGKTVTVRNYVVHFNVKQVARSMASQMIAMNVGGAIGGGVSGATMPSDVPGEVVGCAKEDLLGGYVSNEIPLTGSPIVTVIDLDVDGHPFHFRSISDTDDKRTRKPEELKAHFRNAHTRTFAELQPTLETFVAPAEAE